jgi:CheY-like chemotaxis protein
MEKSNVHHIKKLGSDVTVLYAEDNTALREKAGQLLRKVFKNVHLARDGKEALEIFEKIAPQIVITDIKMPNMDGIELAKEIHKKAPHVKIIILSAYDSKSNLFESIKLGVFRFLTKPVSIDELLKVLLETLQEIHKEQEKDLFLAELKDVFHYQSSIVLMYEKEKIKIASKMFLDFFQVANVAEFEKKYHDLGSMFLEHDGFLYNTPKQNWLENISKSPDKLFYVKMADAQGKIHHFIAKLHHIPHKEGYSIVSFDDITQLNLHQLLEHKENNKENNKQDQKAILDLFDVIQRNNANIKLHNYYKGLSIVYDGSVANVDEKSGVTLKSILTQQRAVLYEKRVILSSEALPEPILCKTIVNNNLKNQTLVVKDFEFLKTSPLQRKYIRLEPERNHIVTLFIDGKKITSQIHVKDISVEGICFSSKEELKLKKDKLCSVTVNFYLDKQNFTIDAPIKFYLSRKVENSFESVFLFELEQSEKQTLSEYLLKRQMQLIREFKGLEDA